jgi:radical SAM family RiPP maturation amino acid epimerase
MVQRSMAAGCPREYRLLYSGEAEADPDVLGVIAHVKRFLERWVADDGFRAWVQVDAQAAADHHGILVDAEAIRSLWDPAATLDRHPVTDVVHLYREYIQEKLAYRDRMRITEGVPDQSLFRKWRQRQINRFFRQVPIEESLAVVHAPFAVELNQGCSVGCWFCGVDAPPLTATSVYTPEQAVLWREMLQHLHAVIGIGAQTGFCYWATDPLDNPDYELFLADFHREFGRYPQTTTAQPLRDVSRVKALLEMTTAQRPMINRFSVLSLPMFNAVHRRYTAEQLLHVEIVCQQPQSVTQKANAGRVRRLESGDAAAAAAQGGARQSTIACVSGFLINLPNREIRLISPTPACERWPLGYRIYGRAEFTDGPSFRSALESLISGGMLNFLRLDDRVALPGDLEPSFSDGCLSVRSGHYRHTFTGCEDATALLELIRCLQASPRIVADVMQEMLPMCSMARSFQLLGLLLSCGLIDDEQYIL